MSSSEDNIEQLSSEDSILSGDEEVLSLDGSDNDMKFYKKIQAGMRNKVADSDESSNDDEDGAEEGWGATKNTYYGMDDEENDQEEKEALRLQAMQAQLLSKNDFLDDSFQMILDGTSNFIAKDNQELPQIQEKIELDLSKMTQSEQARLLRSKNPRVLVYTKEFSKRWGNLESTPVDDPISALKHLHVANIAFLLSLKNDDGACAHIVASVEAKIKEIVDLLNKTCSSEFENYDESTVETETLVDQESESEEVEDINRENTDSEDTVEETNDAIEVDDFAFEEYQPLIPMRESKRKQGKTLELYGETGELNETDLIAKNDYQKSLKFQIMREDKETVENSTVTKAEKKLGKTHKEGPGLKLGEFDDEGDSLTNENDLEDSENGMADENANYYLEMKEQKRIRKESREAHHKALQESFDPELFVEHNLEGDQKRKADYKILANKGLTPHRKKELRNPRVKHRKKYETAKKKLGSFRSVAIDKSKISDSYRGETTGIKSDLTRSGKF